MTGSMVLMGSSPAKASANWPSSFTSATRPANKLLIALEPSYSTERMAEIVQKARRVSWNGVRRRIGTDGLLDRVEPAIVENRLQYGRDSHRPT